jgi:prepilin-type N-terminal cleavage/methylation domain-containing protein
MIGKNRIATLRRFRHSSGTHGHSAFTLVELLVVVSIIALLVSIMLPSLKMARERSKQTKCMANLRSIGGAIQTYSAENRGWFPAYPTMGRWGFRVAPRQKTSPSSPLESWGLQSVLEIGCAPRVLPNGLAYPTPVSKPVYLAGDDPTWLCPSNPGPKNKEVQWAQWRNTYSYASNSSENFYFADRLLSGPDAATKRNIPFVFDNTTNLPGESGFIGPFGPTGYNILAADQQAPHRIKGNQKGVSDYWLAWYIDGHVNMNVFNKLHQ